MPILAGNHLIAHGIHNEGTRVLVRPKYFVTLSCLLSVQRRRYPLANKRTPPITSISPGIIRNCIVKGNEFARPPCESWFPVK